MRHIGTWSGPSDVSPISSARMLLEHKIKSTIHAPRSVKYTDPFTMTSIHFPTAFSRVVLEAYTGIKYSTLIVTFSVSKNVTVREHFRLYPYFFQKLINNRKARLSVTRLSVTIRGLRLQSESIYRYGNRFKKPQGFKKRNDLKSNKTGATDFGFFRDLFDFYLLLYGFWNKIIIGLIKSTVPNIVEKIATILSLQK